MLTAFRASLSQQCGASNYSRARHVLRPRNGHLRTRGPYALCLRYHSASSQASTLPDHDIKLYTPLSGSGSKSDRYLAVVPNSLRGTPIYDFVSRDSDSSSAHASATATSETEHAPGPFSIIEATKNQRGLGMFASEHLVPGTVIAAENPVLLAALTGSTPATAGTDPNTGTLSHVVGTLASLCRELLSASVLERVSRLSRAAGPTPLGVQDSDALADIIATNSIRVDVDSPNASHADTFAALLLHTSRCNHSCSPNALTDFDPHTCTFSLTALTHIPAESEITISYVDTTLPREERISQLQDKWAFECDCPSCSLPSSASATSDAHRLELRNWFYDPKNRSTALIPLRGGAISDPMSGAALLRETIIPDVERYVFLCDSEGHLHTDYLYPALERGAFAYALLGERGRFLEWAGRAREQLSVFGTGTQGRRRGNFSLDQWNAAIADPEGTIARWGELQR